LNQRDETERGSRRRESTIKVVAGQMMAGTSEKLIPIMTVDTINSDS